ncbi:related to integral membrane protein PTH11 [Rhynchosporium graminicola]|uniref:Related to integral membrane protein PTH11 n=1 Tax=Rhynchosporium graminicola TaxID=2792576 RepID=A0A1E1LKR1_9HELO|nr:related to integral membrane protein PTH11 [Rhynchosporium commune]
MALSLLAESWTWYALACLIVITRYVSRYYQLGSIKAAQADDYIMAFVFCFYTVVITGINILAHLDTNLMLPEEIPLLTPESIASRIRGSKLVVLVEQSMIMTQWGCKICLLLLYNKITMGLKAHFAVKVVAAYAITGWVIMEVLYFGVWCRPFDGSWAVPVKEAQCATGVHHMTTNAIFNISSDIMMLCIPLPLLINSQLPKTNKLILCVLFSLGIFVILCAALNKYYSFAHPWSIMWTFWYVREASTAVFVANMPMCWSLMRRIFKLRAFNGLSSGAKPGRNGYAYDNRSKTKSQPVATSYTNVGRSVAMASKAEGSRVDRSERQGGGVNWWEGKTDANGVKLGRSESEEYIIGNGGKSAVPLEIWESRDVTVDRGSVRDAPGVVACVTTPGLVRPKPSMNGDNIDRGMRTCMYDGTEKAFSNRTTVTSITGGHLPTGRKSESDSSRSGRLSR